MSYFFFILFYMEKNVLPCIKFISFLFYMVRCLDMKNKEERRKLKGETRRIDYRVDDDAAEAGHTINIKSSSIAT